MTIRLEDIHKSMVKPYFELLLLLFTKLSQSPESKKLTPDGTVVPFVHL